MPSGFISMKETTSPFFFYAQWLPRIFYAAIIVISVFIGLQALANALPVFMEYLTFSAPLLFPESENLTGMWLVEQGHTIYPIKPRPYWQGTLYAPLHFFMGAMVFKVFGPDPVAVRAISGLSLLACGVSSWFIVRRCTGDRFAALVWPVFFLIMFLHSTVMVLIRSDALMLGLVMAGIAVYLNADNRASRYLWAGVLFGLGIAAKQTAALIMPALCLMALVQRKALWTLAALGISAGIIYGTAGLMYGFYNVYFWLVHIPAHHDNGWVYGKPILEGWYRRFPEFSYAFLLVLGHTCWCAVRFGCADSRIRAAVQLHLFSISVLAACYLPLSKEGGGPWNTAIINTYLVLYFCLILGYARYSKLAFNMAALIVFVLFLSNAEDLLKHPNAPLPRPVHEQNYARMVQYIRRSPLDIWVTNDPWLTVLAKGYARISLNYTGGTMRAGWKFPPVITHALAAEYTAVITNSKLPWSSANSVRRLLYRYYYRTDLPKYFRPFSAVPTELWIRKKPRLIPGNPQRNLRR